MSTEVFRVQLKSQREALCGNKNGHYLLFLLQTSTEVAEERENKILEERRSRTIWTRKNGRGEQDKEPKKDVAAILLTKKRNKGAGKERGLMVWMKRTI